VNAGGFGLLCSVVALCFSFSLFCSTACCHDGCWRCSRSRAFCSKPRWAPALQLSCAAQIVMHWFC
jgi:hypothetical protein